MQKTLMLLVLTIIIVLFARDLKAIINFCSSNKKETSHIIIDKKQNKVSFYRNNHLEGEYELPLFKNYYQTKKFFNLLPNHTIVETIS